MAITSTLDETLSLEINKLKTNIQNELSYAQIIDTEGNFPLIVTLKYRTYNIDENGKVESFTGIAIYKTSITLKITDEEVETKELKATVRGGLKGEITWNSSDTSIATVDNSGKVTAVGKGTATITAICEEETATCEVTVIKLDEIELEGELTIQTTEMQVKVSVNNNIDIPTTIICEIKDPLTKKVIQTISKEEKLEYSFSNLEGDTEYEVTVNATNEYGKKEISKTVRTLLNQVGPTLTENNTRIIQSGFHEAYTDYWGPAYWFHPFDGNDSTYDSTFTTDENSIGSYIGYDFILPTPIASVTGKIRMKSYKIRYSDDLVNWHDACVSDSSMEDNGDYFSNEIGESYGEHRYWVLYVNGRQRKSDSSALVWTLQFHGITQQPQIIKIN